MHAALSGIGNLIVRVNDRHAGGRLLAQVAARLLETAKDPAHLARLGADHFAVVMTEARTAADAAWLGDEVQRHCLGRAFGVEALIRWNSPELGLVPPIKFIPLLEETGLIVEVGRWALEQATRDHRRWRDSGGSAPRIAVNVSAVQLRRPDFVDSMRQVIGPDAGPCGIDIELTESPVMEDVHSTIAKLQALRALGVRVSVDDFGTGYSSLAYLARLPVQILKIDRAFVRTMLEGANTMMLVSTMVSLAHSLQMEIVAEGVETRASTGCRRPSARPGWRAWNGATPADRRSGRRRGAAAQCAHP